MPDHITEAGTKFADWYGQFVLSPDATAFPEWRSRPLAGGWHLASHRSLPIVPVKAGEEEVGVLLGWPVSPDGRFIESFDLPPDADLVTATYALGGRWLLITADAVYLDPTGSQPAVFSPERKVVASSSGLIPADTDEELAGAFDVVRRNGWYPFGLTPQWGVQRLLPNHALDLHSWTTFRCHYRHPVAPISLEQGAAAVVEAVHAVGKACASEYGLFAALTAGRDSRMLLAALRPFIEVAEFWTAWSDARCNATDAQIARILAKRFGIRHRFLKRVPTTKADIEGWLDRSGWVTAGARSRNHLMGDLAAGGRVIANGAAGEVSRAFYWNDDDLAEIPLTPEEVVTRVKAPLTAVVLEAAETWLSGLRGHDRFHVLDLLYLEHRVGGWASPGNLGSPRTAPTIFFLSRRNAIDAMLAAAPDVKRSGTFPVEVIRQAWPELLDLPFNTPVGLEAAIAPLRSFLRRTRKAIHRRVGTAD